MMKILTSASVVLLGTGLALAQCAATPQSMSTATSTSQSAPTPSALNPQTTSPDSINRLNPVTGQNADSQRNPNAVSRTTPAVTPAATTSSPQTMTVPDRSQDNSTVVVEPSSAMTDDSGSDTNANSAQF